MIETEKLLGVDFDSQNNLEIMQGIAANSKVPMQFVGAYSKLRRQLPNDSNNAIYMRKALPVYLELLPHLAGKDKEVVDLVMKYCLSVSTLKQNQSMLAQIETSKQQIIDMTGIDTTQIASNPQINTLWETLELSKANLSKKMHDSAEFVVDTFFDQFNNFRNKPGRKLSHTPTINEVVNAIKDTEEYFSEGPNRLKIATIAQK